MGCSGAPSCEILLDGLVNLIRKGKASDNDFKEALWGEVAEVVRPYYVGFNGKECKSQRQGLLGKPPSSMLLMKNSPIHLPLSAAGMQIKMFKLMYVQSLVRDEILSSISMKLISQMMRRRIVRPVFIIFSVPCTCIFSINQQSNAGRDSIIEAQR